jgi:hypothetical protein
MIQKHYLIFFSKILKIIGLMQITATFAKQVNIHSPVFFQYAYITCGIGLFFY